MFSNDFSFYWPPAELLADAHGTMELGLTNNGLCIKKKISPVVPSTEVTPYNTGHVRAACRALVSVAVIQDISLLCVHASIASTAVAGIA